jgi:hypothetical protein
MSSPLPKNNVSLCKISFNSWVYENKFKDSSAEYDNSSGIRFGMLDQGFAFKNFI